MYPLGLGSTTVFWLDVFFCSGLYCKEKFPWWVNTTLICPLLLRYGFSFAWRLAGQQGPGILLFLALQHWDYRCTPPCLAFFRWVLMLAREVSTLLTELSSHTPPPHFGAIVTQYKEIDKTIDEKIFLSRVFCSPMWPWIHYVVTSQVLGFMVPASTPDLCILGY